MTDLYFTDVFTDIFVEGYKCLVVHLLIPGKICKKIKRRFIRVRG